MSKKIKLFISLFLIIAAFAAMLYAEESTRTNKVVEAIKVVVTGTKTEEPIENSIVKTYVVSKKEIEATGASTLKEVLETVPGLNVYSSMKRDFVEIQGLEQNYVKILIDGVPVSGKVVDGMPLENLPVNEIQRIEIVKGATSALYGSDAIGGVVNIITKKKINNKLIGITVDNRYHSTKEVYGEISLSHKSEYIGLRVTAGYENDDGLRVKTNAPMGTRYFYQIPFNDLKNIRADISLYQFKNTDINLSGGYSFFENINSVNLSLGSFTEDERYDGALKLKHNFSDYFSVDTYLSYRKFTHKFQEYNIDYDSYFPEKKSIYEDIENEIKVNWDISLSHSLLLGVNILNEKMDSESINGKRERTTYSLFVQDKVNIKGRDKLFIVPGVRYTYNKNFGQDLSPKISIRFNVSEKIALRTSYGQGYKTPTFKHNYYSFFHPAPMNFWLKGNPDLKPEKSYSFNFSVITKLFQFLNFETTFFYNKLYNLITSVITSDTPGTYQGHSYIHIREYVNKEEAYTTGAEFEISGVILKNLKYSAGYTYLIAKYKEEDKYEDLYFKSPHSIKFRLSYIVPKLNTKLNLNTIWNSKQLIGENEYSPEYLMLNLNLRQPLFSHYEIYGGVKNLLDNKEEYFGLYDGRVFYIGGKVKFDDITNLF